MGGGGRRRFVLGPSFFIFCQQTARIFFSQCESQDITMMYVSRILYMYACMSNVKRGVNIIKYL